MNYSVYMTTSDPATLGTRTPGVAVTGTNTYYSDPWSCRSADGFGFTATWTGTLTGTLTIWKTDKPEPNLANDDDWKQDAEFGSTPPTVAVSGAGGYANSAMNAKNLLWRFKYVNATNSGTLFADVTVNKGR